MLTTPSLPGFSPRSLWRRFTLTVAGAAVALAGVAVGTRPAQADADDILRFLAGAIIIGAIVHAVNEDQQPHYAGRWVLPGECLETIRVNHRNIEVYNGRCLSRAGYDNLPNQCRRDFRVNGHNRTGFIAECLYDSGYRADGGYYPNPGYRPDPAPQFHPRTGWLPSRCEMTYRQGGRRIEGYWASCLRDEGLGRRDLPGACLVTSTDGDGIYNARCLEDQGYRRNHH